MTGRLQGKTVVVTGASRGIGEAIAHRFAAEGAMLVLAARSSESLDRVRSAVAKKGGDAETVEVDVTSDTSVADLASAVLGEFGPPDVVVNNAGTTAVGHFTELPLDEFRRVVEVNYLGVVRVLQAFLPAMLDVGQGSLISIASTAGKYGTPYQTPYNSSKHAVVGLTRSLGLEVASRGVRVNAIAPGMVRTPMLGAARKDLARVLALSESDVEENMLQRVPMGRFLDPEEVAHLAVYLASDESVAMTGQTLTISGGLVVA